MRVAKRYGERDTRREVSMLTRLFKGRRKKISIQSEGAVVMSERTSYLLLLAALVLGILVLVDAAWISHQSNDLRCPKNFIQVTKQKIYDSTQNQHRF